MQSKRRYTPSLQLEISMRFETLYKISLAATKRSRRDISLYTGALAREEIIKLIHGASWLLRVVGPNSKSCTALKERTATPIALSLPKAYVGFIPQIITHLHPRHGWIVEVHKLGIQSKLRLSTTSTVESIRCTFTRDTIARVCLDGKSAPTTSIHYCKCHCKCQRGLNCLGHYFSVLK